MKSNAIKKIVSTMMLVAFTLPQATAFENYNSIVNTNTTVLSGDVRLTQNNSNVTISLRDSDVKQVLRMFADKAGLNIIFHDSVSGKVTLDLVNTPINDAFAMILQISKLNYYIQGNTMIVMSKDSEDNAYYSKQEMMTFPVQYVSAGKIADFLNKNVFSMKKAGLSGVEAATVNSATNELVVFGMPGDVPIIKKVIEQFDREPYTRTFVVNHTTPAEMANMICEMLLPSRGVETGKSTGGAAGIMTGGAASTGSGSELKLGEGVVACSVSNSVGGSQISPFDVQNLSIAYFPQRGTITLMGGSQAQANMIENFIKFNDIKQPQAYLELSLIELTEDGSKDFSNVWNFDAKHLGISFSDGTTNVSQYNTKDIQSDPRVGYGSNSYLTWKMSYILENKKGRVLANPKILITNGQESVIDITQDYVEKVTSQYLNSGSTVTSGVAQKDYSIGDDLGIKVSLTPFISPEGYVTMNIKPEYSVIDHQETTRNQMDPPTSDVVATLLSRRNLDLKNVRIKDGETLVIGGLIQETESKTVKKVPILGDLPVIGVAFRSTHSSKKKNELVIMITPKIINDGEEGTLANTNNL